jgi:hypothetical protein
MENISQINILFTFLTIFQRTKHTNGIRKKSKVMICVVFHIHIKQDHGRKKSKVMICVVFHIHIIQDYGPLNTRM